MDIEVATAFQERRIIVIRPNEHMGGFGRFICTIMTSLRYCRIFCLEFQNNNRRYKILKRIDRLCDIFYIIEPRSLKFGRRI